MKKKFLLSLIMLCCIYPHITVCMKRTTNTGDINTLKKRIKRICEKKYLKENKQLTEATKKVAEELYTKGCAPLDHLNKDKIYEQVAKKAKISHCKRCCCKSVTAITLGYSMLFLFCLINDWSATDNFDLHPWSDL